MSDQGEALVPAHAESAPPTAQVWIELRYFVLVHLCRHQALACFEAGETWKWWLSRRYRSSPIQEEQGQVAEEICCEDEEDRGDNDLDRGYEPLGNEETPNRDTSDTPTIDNTPGARPILYRSFDKIVIERYDLSTLREEMEMRKMSMEDVIAPSVGEGGPRADEIVLWRPLVLRHFGKAKLAGPGDLLASSADPPSTPSPLPSPLAPVPEVEASVGKNNFRSRPLGQGGGEGSYGPPSPSNNSATSFGGGGGGGSPPGNHEGNHGQGGGDGERGAEQGGGGGGALPGPNGYVGELTIG